MIFGGRRRTRRRRFCRPGNRRHRGCRPQEIPDGRRRGTGHRRGGGVRPGKGMTSLFIHPPYRFGVIDGLVTAVRQRKGEFLHCRLTRLADMVTANTDRIPARDLSGTVFYRIDNDAHGWSGREHKGLLETWSLWRVSSQRMLSLTQMAVDLCPRRSLSEC